MLFVASNVFPEARFFWNSKSQISEAPRGADAQFSLGWKYAHGDSVPQDYPEASKWYRKAAEQGHTDAQINLGFMYHRGLGVRQDLVEAYTWYTVAAAGGNTDATFRRDNLMRSLTPEQIAEGQGRAAAFLPRKTRGGIRSSHE
jgi:TPR repeat protein